VFEDSRRERFVRARWRGSGAIVTHLRAAAAVITVTATGVIIARGGIAPLIDLLRQAEVELQEPAAGVLKHMASHSALRARPDLLWASARDSRGTGGETRAAIAAAGAIPALLALLSSPAQAVQVLSTLARALRCRLVV
jgi:hypothetical protein